MIITETFWVARKRIRVAAPSPFPPAQLAVLAHGRIRTHLKARAETLADVVQAIIALVECRRGNYLVYLPSYPYLGMVQEQFHRLGLDCRCWLNVQA